MSYFKGTNRNGPTAWSPTPHNDYSSLLAAATSANGISDSFNSSSYLEIFNVDTSSQDFTIPVVKKIELSDSVHSLAWGNGAAAGVIACGLPSGAISLVDAASVLGEGRFENPIISTPQKHTNQVTAIKFNKFKSEIFASGSGSEVLIWNLANIENPVAYAPGVGAASSEPIIDLQWNEEYFHILGTSTQTGKIIVWDLRNKKVAVQFNCKASSIAWSPINSMQVITSSEGDDSPVLQLWDLKNTRMPIATFTGHKQAIWSTSWCPHDSSYLLSTGKENRAICWDVSDGSIVDDINLRSEWNSNIQWNPTIPGLFSVTSDQGQINVYTLNDVKGKKISEGNYSRVTPPSWLRRPAGASFGFGGKLIEVNNSEKKIEIKSLPSNQQVLEHSNKIESLIKLDDNENYCKERANNANNNDESDVWNFIGAQFTNNSRSAIVNILGFNKNEIEQAISSSQLLNSEELKENHQENQNQVEIEEVEEKKEKNDVSNLFEGEDVDPFAGGNQDDLFNPFGNAEADPWSNIQTGDEVTKSASESDDNKLVETSLLELVEKYKFQNQSFTFVPENISDADKLLSKALILGNYQLAVEFCLKTGRLSDALIIAVSSNDTNLLNKTKETYFNSLPKSSCLHLLDKVSNKQLLHLIAQSKLSEWKYTLAVICSYADEENFSSLCTSLGELLEDSHFNHDAVLCYITAKNLGRAILLWEKSLNEGSPLIQLQSVVEKITIFRKISNYSGFSPALASKYCDYAIILASHGLLQQALDLVSSLENESPKISELRDRLKVSLGSPVSSVSNSLESARDFNVVESFSLKQADPTKQGFNPFNPAPFSPAPFSQAPPFSPGNRVVPPPFTPTSTPFSNQFAAPFKPTPPITPPVNVQPLNPNFGQPANVAPVSRPVSVAPPLQPLTALPPVQPAPVQLPPVQTRPPAQPVRVDPQPVYSVPPVQLVQPAQPNRFAPNLVQAVPITAPAPAPRTAPILQPILSPAPRPNAQLNTNLFQRPTQAFEPKVEVPEPKELNIKAGEIVDRLIAAIEGCKQHYKQTNPSVVKELEGCGNDRLEILKLKLQADALTPETVTHIENFVKAFSESNSAGANVEFEWLSHNKYTDLTAKVMLGLKKLATATTKFS